ncbi:ABC transporter permease [bacterium]|nr:ABC transporter permease [bacterium]
MNLTMMYNLFIRDFRKQKKRITLTLVALAWGTMSIMLLLAFGEGLHRQMALNQRGLGNNIAVMWGGQTTKAFKGLGKGRPIRFQAEDPEYIAARIPEIKQIAGEYSRWGVKVQYKDQIVNEHITGIYPNFEDMRFHIPQMGGRMINQIDMEHRRRVAFLGWDLSERLFGEEDPIGKQILVNSTPFIVIGVMAEKMQMNSYEGMDENLLAMPSTTFKAIFGDPWLDDIVYQPHDPKDMPIIEKKLYEVLGAKYKFDPADDRTLQIWDVVSSQEEFTNIMIGIKMFLGIIGSLTLLIAGVGVANIMYVSIKERTREIGIKMAVGAKKKLILSQFLTEALMITFTGGAIGMTISYLLTEGFKRLPLSPDAADVVDFMGRPTVSFEIGFVVIAILGLMGLFSGLFPAMRAASVNPVESLRYE